MYVPSKLLRRYNLSRFIFEVKLLSLAYADSASAVPQCQEPCATQQQRWTRQPLCKYWVNTGSCLRGDACNYQHVKPSQLPELRQGWVTARYILPVNLQQRRAVSHANMSPLDTADSTCMSANLTASCHIHNLHTSVMLAYEKLCSFHSGC